MLEKSVGDTASQTEVSNWPITDKASTYLFTMA